MNHWCLIFSMMWLMSNSQRVVVSADRMRMSYLHLSGGCREDEFRYRGSHIARSNSLPSHDVFSVSGIQQIIQMMLVH